jgi:uncharacterized protein YdeI (YjbR/CyaY-like superfamily)
MGTRDPRIDAYIEGSAPFAQPILRHLRELVHEACPQVEETMKWSMPHFMYHGMLAGMSAFKQHAAFGFWKGSLIEGLEPKSEAMGQFGCIRDVRGLPSKRLIRGWIRQAMKLNEDGVKAPARAKRDKPRAEAEVPPDLAAALKKNRAAKDAFAAFRPSHRREYVEWIGEAKQQATRDRRLAQAIEWIAAGKSRNWKYESC